MATQVSFAQTYPTRPVRLIVPFQAGAGTDIAARLVATAWSERTGQQMVVDNVTGAGGSIGATQAAHSRPDGYTLLFSFLGTHVLNPSLYKNPPYNPQTQLEPLAPAAAYNHVLVVSPNLPVSNIKEFVEFGRANPGKLNLGTVGVGSGGHIIGSALAKRFDMAVVHVPYRGSGPVLADLSTGGIQFAIDTPLAVAQLVKAGRVKALGVMSETRNPTLPNVPTFVEQGISGFNADGWFGLFAPKGIPEPVLSSIKRTLLDIVRSDAYQKKILELNYLLPQPAALNDFAAFVESEFRVWTPRVKDSGASLE
ncbi:tripartite tricarboxylate transporter substrate binding protein [Hydrogenophaga sp.]|uniref:Bug family tripartite tricarboxylate transporter substrate binding protein n=1 Tax=Hydrogenophaga sp. TaxID=1904254 RepID=UPI0027228A04|nr:tripartite tricarboxylate transporter substrate binding protein [Hydrogenophaga sp.]MDO9435927.1 tripartite tricarboxylate transporter substrate binding protein [Hydrogenophaga sp.]